MAATVLVVLLVIRALLVPDVEHDDPTSSTNISRIEFFPFDGRSPVLTFVLWQSGGVAVATFSEVPDVSWELRQDEMVVIFESASRGRVAVRAAAPEWWTRSGSGTTALAESLDRGGRECTFPTEFELAMLPEVFDEIPLTRSSVVCGRSTFDMVGDVPFGMKDSGLRRFEASSSGLQILTVADLSADELRQLQELTQIIG